MVPLSLQIIGMGRYLPDNIIKNDVIEARCGLPPGWISTWTGVEERRWVQNESNAFMAAQATHQALNHANLDLNDINLIINASGTQAQAIPDGGPLLQRELGLQDSGIPAFSVHATCLSFVVALNLAANLLQNQPNQHILIVSADIASVGLNFAQPQSASLLGDGACATIVRGTPAEQDSALLAYHFETYATGATFTEIRGGGTQKHPNKPQTQAEDNLFDMEGSKVLRLTRKHASSFLERLRPGLSADLGQIKLAVPHQTSLAGLRMLQHFGWPQEKIMITLPQLGNCVAASIPLTLYQAFESGRLNRGDEVLLIGTGAGLSFGGLILRV